MNTPKNPIIHDLTADTLLEASRAVAALQDHIARHSETPEYGLTPETAQGILNNTDMLKDAIDYEAMRSTPNGMPLPRNHLIGKNSKETLSRVNNTLLFLDDYFYRAACNDDNPIDGAVFAGLRSVIFQSAEAIRFESKHIKKRVG